MHKPLPRPGLWLAALALLGAAAAPQRSLSPPATPSSPDGDARREEARRRAELEQELILAERTAVLLGVLRAAEEAGEAGR